MGPISTFMERNYRHFNARETLAAAKGWKAHLDKGGKMFLALAGAMSTAELGISLAEMIRNNKVHAISCSANNLEEDIYNLVAHDFYKIIPHYKDLTPKDEMEIFDNHLARVTDTCIPEEEAMRRIDSHLIVAWQKADKEGKQFFPWEYFYDMIKSGVLKQHYQIDPKDSWVVAACEKGIPIYTPGYEDSSSGNVFAARLVDGMVKHPTTIKSGFEQLVHLKDWYVENSKKESIGFFQIGGGIAGDFPICVVPMITEDLHLDCPCWGYFAQIGDSTTSYGSYSGAVPNEKITWGKLLVETPKFMINSDATIVAPLIFNYVLDK